MPGFRKGLECKCKRADNKPYAGTNANTTHIETPDPDTCCVISITQLSNGALIGVGAYPILGTRIWCRYGCPLAGMMKLFGTYSKSRAIIVADDKCKGIGHCSVVCPMGIDVESFAHKSRVPLHGDYGLSKTPCISCGSCVATCPAGALKFEKIIFPKATSLESKS